MKKYDIKCKSLDKPDEWMFLYDSDHAMNYAAGIYKSAYLSIKMYQQYEDFKQIFNETDSQEIGGLDKRGYLAFQIQFQHECLREIQSLRSAFDYRSLSFPSVPCEPSGT
jgi:hypothetical protein